MDHLPSGLPAEFGGSAMLSTSHGTGSKAGASHAAAEVSHLCSEDL